MDEIALLRRFRADPPHPSADEVETARAKLMAAIRHESLRSSPARSRLRPSPPRRRWVAAAGAAAALAIAAVVALIVFLAAPSGENKINVVAEARAALPSAGELLHASTVSTISLVGADEGAQKRFDEFARRHPDGYAPSYFEEWSTDGRWRVAVPAGSVSPEMLREHGFHLSDQELQGIGLTHEVTGPTQEAYADGVDSLYVEKLGVIVRARFQEAGSKGADSLGSAPGMIYTGAPFVGRDPVATIRAQLDRGLLRDAGSGEVDGRSVRRLVTKSGEPGVVPVEYDVDAQTFEPVRFRTFGHWPDSPYPPERMAEGVDFKAFESLPLNSDTEQQLKIQAPPGTTVIDAHGPNQ
jgi:hypothetical protein